MLSGREPIMESARLVARIPLKNGQELRALLQDFEGRQYVDCRTFAPPATGVVWTSTARVFTVRAAFWTSPWLFFYRWWLFFKVLKAVSRGGGLLMNPIG